MVQTQITESKYLSSFSVLVKVIVCLLALNLLVERVLQLLPIYTLGDNFSLSNTLMMSLKLPFFWTGLLVPVVYLCALWTAANVLKKYALSMSFDLALLQDLRALGDYLMYAAMAAILFVPSIEAWINQGSRHIKWNWNIDAVSVGMIGMILKFIAQNAQNSKVKNDSIPE
ncbi:hypothetical protein [Undibacterium flavidum]|uniref:DUF2975 family protein n=1 Tax=Undibacterium flavidum TaxID=2762297 RepID=A0ABR6YCT9_9BURK|nr:hypothetical protein [Undibacterium flavidum]MBC3874353.1 hypothetical protein [Undibacterium flavidum]